LAEEHIYEESFLEDFNDEDPNEIQHPNEETLVYVFPFEENEVL
jgi:hypothetical protein